MVKMYFIIVSLIILSIALFGFVLPALFSAESYEAVVLGVFLVVNTPLFAIHVVRKLLTTKGEKRKCENP